jgi:hypothetical protein
LSYCLQACEDTLGCSEFASEMEASKHMFQGQILVSLPYEAPGKISLKNAHKVIPPSRDLRTMG